MRPNLTFQTGRDLAIKPRDVISNRSFNVQRSTNRENSRYVQADVNDDSLNSNESGYDVVIKEKGITSSSPVVLGIVPIRTAAEEEEIINIQRNLNIQTIKPVSKIIDQVSGSFNDAEARVTTTTPTSAIKTAFNDLFSVYQPKFNYLNYIDDFLELQVADSPSFEISIKQISSQGTVIFDRPRSSGISTYASTRTWASNRALMRTYSDRFNISNMMQMLKNTLSRLRYTTLGSNRPAEDATFSVDGFALASDYADAGSIILNLYNTNQVVFEGDFDSVSDQLLLIIAKEEIFNRSFPSGLNIRDSITALTGDLVNDLRPQNFHSKPNLGVFNNLVYQENQGKTVLSFDNILTNQEYLNNFETADQFYLVYPIANDRQLLASRTSNFEQITNNLVPQMNSFLDKLTRDNQATVIKSFFSTLNDFISGTILVNTPIESISQFNQAKAISVLLKAKEDKRLLDYIIKILMLRDRIRHARDYVSDAQRSDFVSASTSELRRYVWLLTKTYFGFSYEDPEEPDGPLSTQSDGHQRIADILNGAGIGRDAGTRILERQWGETSGRNTWSISAYTAFDPLRRQLLDTSTGMVWDIFFDGAKTVENSLARSVSSFDGNPFNSRAGKQTQFYQVSRDHRALAFIMSTLKFLTTGVSETRYYMQATTGVRSDQTTYEYDFGHQPAYFNDLSQSISLIVDNTFSLSVGATAGVSFLGERVYNDIRTSLVDFSSYASAILTSLLQSIQDGIDGVNYVNTYVNTTLTLLKSASAAAFNYNVKYGESLATLYTSNTLTNIAKIKNRSFVGLDGFKKYNSYYFRPGRYLPGMVQYAQKVLPSAEDSFIVLCGLPYGLLERLGAYNLSRERNVNITLTFREINNDSPVSLVVNKRYPATSFIDPGNQAYDIESFAGRAEFLGKTRLYYLNRSGELAVDTFTDESIKSNELESTAVLEYLRILYGLDLDLEALVQNNQVDASELFPGLESAKNKVLKSIEELRYDDLITSRYISTAESSIMLNQQDIFQKSMAGFSFDKIIAIPVDGSSLRRGKDFYLCDVLISVTLSTQEEIQVTTAEEVARAVGSRSSRVSSTASSIVRNAFRRST